MQDAFERYMAVGFRSLFCHIPKDKKKKGVMFMVHTSGVAAIIQGCVPVVMKCIKQIKKKTIKGTSQLMLFLVINSAT